MQRSDDLVGVRNGHVVFTCDGRVQATVTASWYRQMGFPNVYAVDGGTHAWVAAGLALTKGQAPSGCRVAGWNCASAQWSRTRPRHSS